MVGRERSNGGSDGLTSLRLDIVLIYFLRYPYKYVPLMFCCDDFRNLALFSKLGVLICGRLRQRGRERISCQD